jgi:hypothetical protein
MEGAFVESNLEGNLQTSWGADSAYATEISAERRRAVLDEVTRAFAALRADEMAWAAEEGERALWDTVAFEGLPADAWSTEDFASGE